MADDAQHAPEVPKNAGADGVDTNRVVAHPPIDEREYQLKKAQLDADLGLKRSELDDNRRKFEAELALKRDELDLNRRNAARSAWSSPLLIAIIGLFATVLANLVQNTLQSVGNQKLERQRFEAALIQKALDTSNVTEAAKRLQFLLNLGLISDESGKIAGYVSEPETIPVQPTDEAFRGIARRQAKLSIGSGPVETHRDFGSLARTLVEDEKMAARAASKDPSNARLPEEQRNVRVPAYLYAAKREISNDYRLVVCDAVDAGFCMVAVVSGLPDEKDSSYPKLEQVRKTLLGALGGREPSRGYRLYDPPLKIEISGSLLFNATHPLGAVGPSSLREKIKTRWEIHPVTELRVTR